MDVIQLEKRPRDEKGHFLKTSTLSDKNLGVRLFKSDYSKVVKLAEEKGIRPTELVRMAMNEWLTSETPS
ncbi:MAG: hypothetical protein RLZZ171_2604 [Cyanobacteriota bacterium]|jgi:hypothetical protein